jgi:hypothetical protein
LICLKLERVTAGFPISTKLLARWTFAARVQFHAGGA